MFDFLTVRLTVYYKFGRRKKILFCPKSVIKIIILKINWICFFLRKAETHSLPAAFILRSYTFIIVLPLFTVVAPSFWFESCCYIYIYLKCYLTIFFCFKLSQPLLLCIVLFIVLLPLLFFLFFCLCNVHLVSQPP